MKRIVCIAIATIAICLTSTSYAQSGADCTAPIVQALAPEGMVVAPIADANLDLGPHPTGALAVQAADGFPAY